jgi:type VII secretion protein EccB
VQSRRDHLHAYQFSTSRLVYALMSGDPGVGDVPFRRARFGTIVGIVIAVLLSGGAVVYGLISPAADTTWRKPGSIIVEKETGTRYLYLSGVLRPTANYTSAMLVAGQNASVKYVTRSALAGIPVGSPIGIPGAPDTLPPAASLLPGNWALCLRPGDTGNTVLDLAPAARAVPAPAHRRILVGAPAAGGQPATEFVLWGATKYPLPNRAVLPALGLGNDAPVTANSLWLAAFPTGTELGPAQIPAAGSPGPQIAGKPTKVGQLFEASAAGVDQFYVLRADGLAPVTRTEAALFSVVHGYVPPARVSPSDIAAAPASGDAALLRRLPDLLSGTAFSSDGTTLCAQETSPGTAASTELVTENAADVAADPDVVLPNGRGMLVQLPASSSGAISLTPTDYLIAGGGVKYLVNGGDAVQALGYSGVTAQVMPAQVLSLIPSGPALAVSLAQRAVPWGSG